MAAPKKDLSVPRIDAAKAARARKLAEISAPKTGGRECYGKGPSYSIRVGGVLKRSNDRS